ncbi:MAG: hypothetical protein RLZZ403_1796, partial [Pseudomonadota bacterium]
RLLGRQLHPVCQISYQRTARVGMAEGQPIRMTLDRNLRATAQVAHPFDNRDDGTPLLDQSWILELKYRHALPALFKRLITELAPAPQRVSKYRLAVSALGLTAPAAPSPPSRLATESADA